MWISDYVPEEPKTVFDVADGAHSCRLDACDIKQSKAGKRMLVVRLTVNDSNDTPYYYNFVEGEYFNSMMTAFFDCFGIERGDFNGDHWARKTGRAYFKHVTETYIDKNGNEKTATRAEIKKWLKPGETVKQETSAPTSNATGFEGVNF